VPIETIVVFFVGGTLAYFHILHAIKHSAFLATPALPPAYALLRPHTPLLALAPADWRLARARLPAAAPELVSLVLPPADPALSARFVSHLTTSVRSPSGHSYGSLCFRPANASCFTHYHHSPHSPHPFSTFSIALADADWLAALAPDALLFSDPSGVEFRVAGPQVSIESMRTPTWVAYAARTLVERFWLLAKKADSLDIFLLLAGYILMHITFFLLITRSRRLGSNFWLPLAILSTGILALLLALPLAMALRIPIDPVSLTEALPFLVCTIGFDKPLRFARAVFTHPHLFASPVPGVNLKPAPRIVTESFAKVYPPIIRDYVLEIAVLLAGAYSGVRGLSQVCALAAIVLAVDCLLLCTFLAAVLAIMIEVCLFSSFLCSISFPHPGSTHPNC